MHVTDEQGVVPWGARINTSRRQKAEDYPAWANPAQKENWEKQGLVLWDEQSREITRLTATQSLTLLRYLGTNEDWRHEGLIVGEPSVEVVRDDPEPRLKSVLAHEMMLSSEQTQAILDLLETNEAELQVLSKVEESGYQQKRNQFLNLLADILVQPPREKGSAPGHSE